MDITVSSGDGSEVLPAPSRQARTPSRLASARRDASMAMPVTSQARRLLEPRRLAAVVIIALAGAAMATWLLVRGELVGADARAYWAGVRLWLDGRDMLHPPSPYLPYVYVPWSIPLFLPWAALPWDVAWFALRGLNLVLLVVTAAWAYRRHRLATALLLALLLVPLTATFDTGNITFLCALPPWVAVFVGPRTGGLAWALATALKWFPAALFLVLPPRARLWGLLGLALAILLSLAVWPATLRQLEMAVGFPRPLRLDYLLLLWGAVPWLWARPAPFEPATWARRLYVARRRLATELAGWWRRPERLRAAVGAVTGGARAYLGL